jgi:Predicted dehydrogenases and related proteins
MLSPIKEIVLPIRIAIIGLGNRAKKYLEYVKEHPDQVCISHIVDPNGMRLNYFATELNLPTNCCYSDYDLFFNDVSCDINAVLITTPDNLHFDPAIKAIHKGYHVLLEKPIAQSYEECRIISEEARKFNVIVGVCHVLRYHPYFRKIKEVLNSGELGEVISVNHISSIGLDRATHSYVRGIFNRKEDSNPLILSKCCHDIDFLLWALDTHCINLSSAGSLKWFKPENAPKNSSNRCINCNIEEQCPFSAKDLYLRRHSWIDNFDIPKNNTVDEGIIKELMEGRFGRCIYHCNNNVVDHQALIMEMENGLTINLSMEMFCGDDLRKTHIYCSGGELYGNERVLTIKRFRQEIVTYDFSDIYKSAYHANADLKIFEDFIMALTNKKHRFLASICNSMESHKICFEAERSRKESIRINLNEIIK